MIKNDLFSELQERNLIAQTTNIEQVKNLINNGKANFYVGIDPTANSLHIGHLLILTFIKRLIEHGNHAIIVIGGGTGYIGDPTNKENMRPMLTTKEIKNNCKSIKKQIKRYLKKNVIILNNSKWLSKLNYIDFLRKIGIHFNVNEMLKAECYQQRMKKGLTFLEFNYMLMQAYDFYYLVNKYHCNLQIGGNDQWSNMLAGIDIIKKISNQSVNILTTNLLLTSNNTKMGKTSEGTIWLDKNKTNEITFQQYWRNIKDDDLTNCFKWLSFKPINEIKNKLQEISKKNFKYKENREVTIPKINCLKKELSDEMTDLFKQINQTIFKKLLSIFKKKTITIIDFCEKDKSITLIELLTQFFINNDVKENTKKESICINIKIAKSFIKNKQIKVNNEIITNSDFKLDKLIKKHDLLKIDNSFSEFNIKIKKVEFNKLKKENRIRFYEKLKNQIIKNHFDLEYIFNSLPTFFLKNENEKVINNMIDNIVNKIMEKTYDHYLEKEPTEIIYSMMLNCINTFKKNGFSLPDKVSLLLEEHYFRILAHEGQIEEKDFDGILSAQPATLRIRTFVGCPATYSRPIPFKAYRYGQDFDYDGTYMKLIPLFPNNNHKKNSIDHHINKLIYEKLKKSFPIMNYLTEKFLNEQNLNSFMETKIMNIQFIKNLYLLCRLCRQKTNNIIFCDPIILILFMKNMTKNIYFFNRIKNDEKFKHNFYQTIENILNIHTHDCCYEIFIYSLLKFIENETQKLKLKNYKEEIENIYMQECRKQKQYKYINLDKSYEEEILQIKNDLLTFIEKQNMKDKINKIMNENNQNN